jgi:hypothetical protein
MWKEKGYSEEIDLPGLPEEDFAFRDKRRWR